MTGSSTLAAGNPDGNVNILTIDLGSPSANQERLYCGASLHCGASNDGTIVYNGKTYTWTNWSDVLLWNCNTNSRRCW